MAGNGSQRVRCIEPHTRPAHQVGQRVLVFQSLAQQALSIGSRYRGRSQPSHAKALKLAFQQFTLALQSGPPQFIHQTQLMAELCQAQVGVVLAQLQAELGPAGKHSVGLGHAFGHQIVDHHAQVGLIATRQPGVAPQHLQRGIGPGIQTLGCGFLVAGGAVDLSCKKQALYSSCFEVRLQFARVEVVVLDGITGPQDVRLLKAHHRPHRRQLNVERQRSGNAVRIELMGSQPFGFQKNLVRRFVGEAVHLVFDAGAVARPCAFDDASEHRAAVETAADDVVGARVGVGNPARHLAWVLTGVAHEAEHRHRARVAGLGLQLAKVDAATIQPRRRAGFQPSLRQLQLLQPRRKGDGRRVARAAGAVVLQPHMNATVEKRTGRQHHRASPKAQANLRDSAHNAVAFHHQVVHRLLEQPQVGLVFQTVPYGRAVQHAVGLRARGTDSRALAAVENAELDAGLVGGGGHRATKSVDFLDQMALADAADRRVATHLPQRFDVVGQQQRAAAHAGSGQCRFGAGMAATHNDHVEFLRVQHRPSLRGHSC